ncbi:MAG: GNAT family N-acetyltransferase [Emcibacteraceae bacterium]|nr:GNAT family N-acetyltransferase [Emcibacteraceae bacterium]
MDYFVRNARKEEAYELAKLVNQAGQGPNTRGLDFAGWSADAKDGQDPFEVGQKIIENEDDPYSYTNMRVVEANGEITAMAMCFEAYKRTPEQLENISSDFRIFKRLTNTIAGCFYLDSLAAKTGFRGKGYGRVMLEDSIKLAKSQGYDAVYLLAFDKNVAGIGLYEKYGFYLVRDLPAPNNPDMPYQGRVGLYKKDI